MDRPGERKGLPGSGALHPLVPRRGSRIVGFGGGEQMADLVMKSISKSFSGVHALTDADFEANYREVHALLGENGAGKSTLIKILSGSLHADHGEIFLDGQKLKIANPHDAVQKGIGTVYQELSLVPDLTVADNMFLNSGELTVIRTMKKREYVKKTEEILHQYGIEGVQPDDVVKNLALPFRQMIEIAKVLAKEPRVVIFDEATSALSEDKVTWLLGVARKIADSGKIVIFISHRMSEIRTGCDRITVFREGRNVGVRHNAQTDADELVSLMLGRKMSTYFPQIEIQKQGDPALELRNVSLGALLSDVSFTLHKREVIGVGGLAGQGQSALFQALCGALQPTGGSILVDGKPVHLKSPYQSQNAGLALIPEDRGSQGLIMPLSVGENIRLPVLGKMKKYGALIDLKRTRKLIKDSMERFAVKAPNEDTIVMELSGGNQQKVVFAKSLSLLPEILLMFDCTRGVDVGTKVEIFNLVRDLAAKGHAILYYSTDVEELTNICDRVFVMYDGKISAVLQGETITKENIIRASVGEETPMAAGKGA